MRKHENILSSLKAGKDTTTGRAETDLQVSDQFQSRRQLLSVFVSLSNLSCFYTDIICSGFLAGPKYIYIFLKFFEVQAKWITGNGEG